MSRVLHGRVAVFVCVVTRTRVRASVSRLPNAHSVKQWTGPRLRMPALLAAAYSADSSIGSKMSELRPSAQGLVHSPRGDLNLVHSGGVNNGIYQSFQDNETVNYAVIEEFNTVRHPI